MEFNFWLLLTHTLYFVKVVINQTCSSFEVDTDHVCVWVNQDGSCLVFVFLILESLR